MRKETANNNFAVIHPDMASLWHPIRNSDAVPEEFLPKSNKVFWWQCEQGHEWQARIEHLSRGLGCSYCSGHRACQENSLETHYPDVARRWHPVRNKDLLPSLVRPGSDKSVWWLCPTCGNEWKARIANMSRQRGSGCPVCQRISIAQNNTILGLERSGSLNQAFPDIAKEWHPTKNGSMTPSHISSHSGRRVWWLCPKGHEWQVSVNQRTRGEGTWCPQCSPNVSKLEVAIYCELKALFGEVEWQARISGVECDILVVPLKLAVELDGYPWHEEKESSDRKKNGIFSRAGYRTMRVRDRRLGRLSPIDVLYDGRNPPLRIVKTVLSALLEHDLCPANFNAAINMYLQARVLQNEEEYRCIVSQLPGPPYEHSLEHLRSDLSTEWHSLKNLPMTPSLFTVGSSQKVWWVCRLGHEWRVPIVDRAQKGRGCPVCARVSRGQQYKNLAVKRKGSLAERSPALANEWHPSKNGDITPKNRSSGSQEKVWWLCKRGHEWQASIVSRSRGNGCPFCAGRLPAKENCLATENPQLG